MRGVTFNVARRKATHDAHTKVPLSAANSRVAYSRQGAGMIICGAVRDFFQLDYHINCTTVVFGAILRVYIAISGVLPSFPQ